MACPSDAVLARFVDGALAAPDGSQVEVHLDGCTTCRQTVSAAVRRGSAGATVRAAGDAARAGDRLGRYVLISPVGAGQMGVVYAAHDPELDRRIAVKLLAPTDSAPDRRAARQARLAREARALARISHPNVMPVHDVGTEGDRLYIAIELVDGHTLREHVTARAPDRRRRVELVVQAGRGLAAAHAAGVIHRDLKPDNILVGEDGRVRVGDFGLAAADDAAEDATGGDTATSDPVKLTRSGALIGTPAYMAPELLRGEPATAASDQFALCVTGWEVVFDQRPFTGTTPLALAEAIVAGTIAPVPRAGRRLAAALRRGLAADPARRYPDVATATTAIERAARPRRAPIWIAAGLCAAGAAVAWAAWPGAGADPCGSADRTIQAVWTPGARDALTAAFVRTASPIGADTAAATTRAIDRTVTRWSAAATEQCAAYRDGRRSAELHDRQAACLDERAGELAALLEVFGRADVETVERAVAAVGGLGTVEACAAPPVRTIAPDQRAAIEQARAAFARGRALGFAGRYAEAIEVLTPLATVREPALASRIELALGIDHNSLGHLAEARDHFSRAAARADEAGDDLLRARALIESLELAADQAVELGEAGRIADQARAAVARAAPDPTLRADLAAAIGILELRRGRPAEAAAAFDDAIAGYRTVDPVDEVRVANALNDAAGARLTSGDHVAALAMLEESRAIAERALGANHPLVATIWITLIPAYYYNDRDDDAIAAGTRGVELFAAAFGPDHDRVGAALDNLVALYGLLGRPADAMPLAARSQRILIKARGADHVDVATTWLNLGSLHKDLGELDPAADAYARALAIWERALPPDHDDLARVLSALGEVETRRGNPARGVELLDRALAIRERGPAEPGPLATTRFRLAQALRAAGRTPARALALAKAARAQWVDDDASDDVAEVDRWLAARMP